MKTITKGFIVATILGGASMLFAQNANNSNPQITMEQAKLIALQKAGFTESEVKWLKAEYDYDHGRGEYEVEFKKDSMDYEYDIDSITGKITGIKIEEDKWFN